MEMKSIIYTLVRNSQSGCWEGLNLTRVVDLAHVDKLSAEGVSDLIGVALAHNGLVGSLDGVHGVS